MAQISEELVEIAKQLDSIRGQLDSIDVTVPLQKLEDASSEVGKAWSGSWRAITGEFTTAIFNHHLRALVSASNGD